MIRNRQLLIVWWGMMLVGLSVAGGQATAPANQETSVFNPVVDVCDIVRRNYVTEVKEKNLVTGAVRGMLHALDPYSEYIPEEELDEFQKETSGSYEGIGVGIDTQSGVIMVISPFEDSPAYKAGVQAGDIILEVNGQSTKGWSATRAIQELTGPAGTNVTLKLVHREGQEFVVTITREQIIMPTVRGWRRDAAGVWDYMIDSEAKMAYVRITQFTADTANELDRVYDAVDRQGMRAMIMDLRSNPGGLMSSAVEIVDRFIEEGVIVSTRGAHTTEQSQLARAEGTWRRFHLVILVDQGSASASEIVAGSLQDHGRAVVVGKRSWGKGSVQRMIRLPDSGAAIKLTTDHYYLPKGRCVHRLPNAEVWGVDPDVEESLNADKMPALRDLLEKLTLTPLTPAATNGAKKNADAKSTDEKNAVPEDKAALAKEQAQQLMDLDAQLSQAVKQCKGLLRTQPGWQSITIKAQTEPPAQTTEDESTSYQHEPSL